MWSQKSSRCRIRDSMRRGRNPSFAARGGQELEDRRLVVGVDQARELGPLDLRGVVAEHAFHRRADVAHGRIGVDHHHDVGRVLDERSEPRLRLLAEEVLGQRGAVERERDLRGQGLQRVAVLPRQGHLAPDHQQAAELFLHEQRAAQQVRAPVGDAERLGELGLVDRHLIGAVRPEPLPLPRPEAREGDDFPDHVLRTAGGRNDRILVGGLVGDQHADHRALAGDRAGRLQRRRVDPVAVRRRDERGTGTAERALPDPGLLLLPHQTGDPHHDEEEQDTGRADQDREVLRRVPEVLDHHHARREQRGEREDREPAAGEPRSDVDDPLREGSHRSVEGRGAPQDVEGCPTGLEVSGLVVHDPLAPTGSCRRSP